MEKSMKVRLISYSKPHENIQAEGLESVQDLIAFCARVSNPSNQLNTQTSIVSLILDKLHKSDSRLSSFNIFAPSLLAFLGSK